MLSAILGISGCPGRDWIHTLHLDHYYAVTPGTRNPTLRTLYGACPLSCLGATSSRVKQGCKDSSECLDMNPDGMERLLVIE